MWRRRVGGDADAVLGVARQAVLFPPSLEAQNLPRPARHHHVSRTTIRWNGVTIRIPQNLQDQALEEDRTPLGVLLYSKEAVALLDEIAAKAKGSN